MCVGGGCSCFLFLNQWIYWAYIDLYSELRLRHFLGSRRAVPCRDPLATPGRQSGHLSTSPKCCRLGVRTVAHRRKTGRKRAVSPSAFLMWGQPPPAVRRAQLDIFYPQRRRLRVPQSCTLNLLPANQRQEPSPSALRQTGRRL